MEYVIVVFVGLWVTAAGVLAYRQVSKDFDEVLKSTKDEGEK